MPRLRRTNGNPPLSIEAGAAYEFLVSLATVAEIGNRSVAEIGAEWFEATEERAGAELIERLHDFAQGTGDQFVHLLPVAYDAPAPRTVSSFLEHLAAMEAQQIVLHMVGHYEYHYRRTTPPEVMRAAVGGDRQAVAEFLRTTAGWNEWHGFLERHLGRDPEQIKGDLLRLLHQWDASVWRQEEARWLPILERDADAKRDLARQLPFERFVEVATNGVQFVGHPGLERLVLVPSYVSRPWVSHAEHRGAQLMVYPVADESVAAGSDTPPLRLVRVAKALADEKRLRILRALAEKPRSMMELAEQFEMPKTTMHHHMVTLRSAGLVSVGSGTKEYRLRRDALPDLMQLLGGYIGAPPGAEQQLPSAPPAATERPSRRLPSRERRPRAGVR